MKVWRLASAVTPVQGAEGLTAGLAPDRTGGITYLGLSEAPTTQRNGDTFRAGHGFDCLE
jgi:hypothetical protein